MSGELGHSEDLEEVPNTDDFDIASSDKEQELREKGIVNFGIDARHRVELWLEETRLRKLAAPYDFDGDID